MTRLLLALLFASVSCGETVAPEPHPPETARSRRALWAVLVNGGGNRNQNYQSHLLHVRGLVEILLERGIPRDRILLFSGNGPDPEPDLAIREWLREDASWLLHGTRLERPLGAPIEHVRSEVEGFELRAATADELGRWFRKEGSALRRGDTLLLYVTDHGTAVDGDPRNNRITLWGRDEHLSVAELETFLDRLPEGVRVVLLMSQCHSGGFAHLARAGGPDAPRCGYFSTTADRLASGCYPEDRGRANVGHSFEFIRALKRSGRFSAAHDTVLHDDHTPDVPLRTSDVFLAGRLERAAEESGQTAAALADSLLKDAWEDFRLREERAAVESLARTFGVATPHSITEIEELALRLRGLHADVRAYARAWRETLQAALRENLARFLESREEWSTRVAKEALADVSSAERRRSRIELLEELEAFTKADPAQDRRLRELRGKTRTAAALEYRMQARGAAALRLRTLLTTLAGRAHAASAIPSERAAIDALLLCEDLRLPAATTASPSAPRRSPLPPLEVDVQRVATVRPAWMGISFDRVPPDEATPRDLPRGAVLVSAVNPGSPAEAAGIAAGDIVLGPPDRSFEEPREIREWTMRSRPEAPRRLVILRGDRRLEIPIELMPHPGARSSRPTESR